MDVEESVDGTFRAYRIGVKIGVLDRRVAADLAVGRFLYVREPKVTVEYSIFKRKGGTMWIH